MKEEKIKHEEELLLVEKKYSGLAEEVEDQRRVNGVLRQKYKGALEEVKDLEHEHQEQKEELLQTIRLYERELSFYQGLFEWVLTGDDMRKIKGRATFDEESKEWTIPPFSLKQKDVMFPKIINGNARAYMDAEKENREVQFGNPQRETPEEVKRLELKGKVYPQHNSY